MKCLIFSIAILLQVYPSLVHLLTASNFLVILLNSFSVLDPQEGHIVGNINLFCVFFLFLRSTSKT